MAQDDDSIDLPDLRGLEREDWLRGIQSAGEAHGYFETLGRDHAAVLIEDGAKLIVTFETTALTREEAADSRPRGWRFVEQDGWSTLTILAGRTTWFRDPKVFAYFDRLVDDGFFDEFEDVLFHGAHSGAYAAAAYSVAAPGSRVLALRPQATLDPRVAGWEPRYKRMRRTSFTDRYGYAPSMLDGADHAWIAYDPAEPLDAMHGALFTRANVTALRCHRLGLRLDRELERMKLLDPMIREAMAGTLSARRFAELFRARRSHPAYLRSTLAVLERAGRLGLAERVARHGALATGRRGFKDKLAELRGE
ncbi:MAG: phosphoadenosine phosphosulfate reductase [Paracoccaceae bacterium]